MEHVQQPQQQDATTRRAGVRRPLSFAQERLWSFGQLAPASLNVPMAMHLHGPLDVEALQQVLRHLVRRHSLLRTRFFVEHGVPVQEVLAAVDFDIPVVERRGLSDPAREDATAAALADAVRRPLDPGDPPLLRPHLLRFDDTHHLLIVRLSHLVVDEVSRVQLVREMAALYGAFTSGTPAHLPEIRGEYGDFAQWERDQLAGASAEHHLEFWRRYLSDLPPLLEVPADRPRPAQRAYEGAWRARVVGAPIGAQVQTLARAERVTTFHVLLSAFAVLLARLTGCDDIAVGTPVSRRPDVRYEGVVGPFLNNVVVRTDCAGDPTFRALVRKVRARAIAALAHSDVPFETVIDRLGVVRDPSYHPLVQVWFVYKANRGGPPGEERSWVTPIEQHETTMPFDITWSIAEHEGGFSCSCSYDTALFDAGTIDRLLDYWERILVEATADPDRTIGSYDLLSPAERQQQLVAWNATATTWPGPGCVHEAIAEVAARTPGAVAVRTDGAELTYGQLVARAGALADQLRRAGVGPDVRVALVLDRSIDLVVAILGTLEAGGAYVPLDPAASPERMTTVLRNADAACVVTRTALRDAVPRTGIPLVCVDALTAQGPRATRVSARPAAANLCYVLYTSGTTGEPKGVAIPHAALTNALYAIREAIGISPGDALLAIAPITFDIATLEILLPLLCGATVVVAPEHAGADGAGLKERLEREGISVLQATPTTWRLLLDAGWRPPEGFRCLSGAEPLPRELARQLIAAAGHVWNLYGPTETTIYNTFERLISADGPITIGGPMANTSAYLLDRALRPVPTGVPAEIYIGGACVARGYLGRPGLTASLFRPDPFAAQPGGRMYASGDVARFCRDGRIECRGRRDHQIKLHGRRIELGAIAHVLESHPQVGASVVVVREEVDRGAFLTAYVTPRDHAPLDRAALREHLARHLPSYMLPAAVVVLDALPQTRRAKLDRGALPPPAESDFRAERTLLLPRTAAEETVAAVWREVLSTTQVGVEDDFFAVGGNSIQAMRVLLLVRDALGVEVSVRAFFEQPTVAALAAEAVRLGGHRGARAPASHALTPVAGDRPLVLAPQQQTWWRNEYLAGNVNPNNIQFGMRIAGALNLDALHAALDGLERRHDALRTSFVPGDDGSGVPVISPPAGRLRAAIADLSDVPGEAAERALHDRARQDKGTPFDLARGPLCRITLVRLGARHDVVLFTTHHLICDEWSVTMLMTELSALYAAALSGTAAALPESTLQYADFARWQHDWITGPGARAQIDYWRRQLAPPWPPLLPAGGDTLDFDGPYFSLRAYLPFAIDADADEGARRLARGLRATLFSTLMSVVDVVLFARTGQRDLRFGTLSSNRRLPGTEHVMGLFTNVVCLRMHVDPAASFRHLVRRVQDTIAEATAHDGVPFDVVAGDIARHYGAPRGDLVQAMIVWLSAPPSQAVDLPGLATAAYRPSGGGTESVVMVRNTLDLRIELMDTAADLSGSITFNMSRFDVEEMRELARDISRCLRLVAADPEVAVSALCEALAPRAVAEGVS